VACTSAAAPSSTHGTDAEGPHAQAYKCVPAAAEPSAPYYWLCDTEEEEQTEEPLEQQFEHSSQAVRVPTARHVQHTSPPRSPTAGFPCATPSDLHTAANASASRDTGSTMHFNLLHGSSSAGQHEAPWPRSSDSSTPSSGEASSLSIHVVALAWEASTMLQPLPNRPNRHLCLQLQRCTHALKQLEHDICAPGVASSCSLEQAAAITWACGSLYGVASKGEQQLKVVAHRLSQPKQQQEAGRDTGGLDPLATAHDLCQARLRLRSAVGVLLRDGPQPWQWVVRQTGKQRKQHNKDRQEIGPSSDGSSSGNASVSFTASPRALSTLLWGLAQMKMRPDIR